ncbi:hypothetical protein BJ742DRAFT_228324 [Cladochytrium replicatum]|nr:hypothetical protein BJ742DRAFT_228324 [Cladochytrium replicatum]
MNEVDNPSAWADVRVTCFSKVYRLHRIMLKQSPLISRLLAIQIQREIRPSVIGIMPQWAGDMEEEQWNNLTIEFGGDPRLTKEGVEVVLMDLYDIGSRHRKDRITRHNAMAVLTAACCFEWTELVEYCVDFVLDTVDPTSIVEYAIQVEYINPAQIPASRYQNHRYLELLNTHHHILQVACLSYLCQLVCVLMNPGTGGTYDLAAPAEVLAQLPIPWVKRVVECHALVVKDDFVRYELAKETFQRRLVRARQHTGERNEQRLGSEPANELPAVMPHVEVAPSVAPKEHRERLASAAPSVTSAISEWSTPTMDPVDQEHMDSDGDENDNGEEGGISKHFKGYFNTIFGGLVSPFSGRVTNAKREVVEGAAPAREPMVENTGKRKAEAILDRGNQENEAPMGEGAKKGHLLKKVMPGGHVRYVRQKKSETTIRSSEEGMQRQKGVEIGKRTDNPSTLSLQTEKSASIINPVAAEDAAFASIFHTGIIYTYMSFEKDEIVPAPIILESFWIQAGLTQRGVQSTTAMGAQSGTRSTPLPSHSKVFRFAATFRNVIGYFFPAGVPRRGDKVVESTKVLSSDPAGCAGVSFRVQLSVKWTDNDENGRGQFQLRAVLQRTSRVASSAASIKAGQSGLSRGNSTSSINGTSNENPVSPMEQVSYSLFAFDRARFTTDIEGEQQQNQDWRRFHIPVTQCKVNGEGYTEGFDLPPSDLWVVAVLQFE